jgi:hypothetical protein
VHRLLLASFCTIWLYRAAAPGFADAFLMLGAPQIGVRHSRRLAGLRKVAQPQWDTGFVWDDEIGVSTSLSPKTPNISVPYGALVPEKLDNILGAGRHVACDPSSHTFLREIPQCWFTGQAAGVAAALAAASGTRPRPRIERDPARAAAPGRLSVARDRSRAGAGCCSRVTALACPTCCLSEARCSLRHRLGLPAQRIQPRHIKKLLRRAVPSRGIAHKLTPVAHDLTNQSRQISA